MCDISHVLSLLLPTHLIIATERNTGLDGPLVQCSRVLSMSIFVGLKRALEVHEWQGEKTTISLRFIWARDRDTLALEALQLELTFCKLGRHAFNLNTCKQPLIPLILKAYKVQIHRAGNKKGIETAISSDLIFKTKNVHSNFYQALYHMTEGKTISRG